MIADIMALDEHNKKRAYGNCKLWMPSKNAQGLGKKAKGLYVGMGPFWMQVKDPLSLYAQQQGRIAQIRATWWTGRLKFETLEMLFPEQSGCRADPARKIKARPKNKYTAAQKAVIRDHTLRVLWLMLQRPRQYKDLDPSLKPRVAKELGIRLEGV
jgi:hypothetical protein